MTREDKAYSFIDREFSNIGAVKTLSLMAAAKLKIPGARKKAGRHLINMAGNQGLSLGSRIAAKKYKLDPEATVNKAHGVKKLATDLGAPTLGKLIVKK